MPWDLASYEPVEDRLRAFWEDHPNGRISTELVHTGADGYIVKASVWRQTYVSDHRPQDRPDATGYAQEAVTERGVNATSALENCETSAIGRALANLGYAAKGKRPSREEMSKASGDGEGSRPDGPAGARPDAAPGEDNEARRDASPPSASPGGGHANPRYVRNPDTLQLEKVGD